MEVASVVADHVPAPGFTVPGAGDHQAGQIRPAAHGSVHRGEGIAVAHAMAQQAVCRGDGSFQGVIEAFHEEGVELGELLTLGAVAADIL